jgi:hypothetical protein
MEGCFKSPKFKLKKSHCGIEGRVAFKKSMKLDLKPLAMKSFPSLSINQPSAISHRSIR